LNQKNHEKVPVKNKSYDDMFKEILETFPPHLIIAFLNSTFKHNMSLEGAVTSLRTESGIPRTTADYILSVTEPNGNIRYFHIEAQTSNDNSRMAFRMVEYGIRNALERARGNTDEDGIYIEFPHAVVFYLKDDSATPKKLNVTIKAPDGQELHYSIPTERMSDYTPLELLEQDKFPMFPFYMANYAGGDTERFEREWQDGCAKLGELVAKGYFGKTDASKLIEDSCIVINKTDLPNEKKEVLKKMTMFDTVGVGTDWIEIKRRQDEAVAIARAEADAKAHKKAVAAAKKALGMGLTVEQAAKIAELPIAEVEKLVK
jgi:hypothetical protein